MSRDENTNRNSDPLVVVRVNRYLIRDNLNYIGIPSSQDTGLFMTLVTVYTKTKCSFQNLFEQE